MNIIGKAKAGSRYTVYKTHERETRIGRLPSGVHCVLFKECRDAKFKAYRPINRRQGLAFIEGYLLSGPVVPSIFA